MGGGAGVQALCGHWRLIWRLTLPARAAPAQAGLGASPAFRVPEYELQSVWELPLVLALGALCGVASAAFKASSQVPCPAACLGTVLRCMSAGHHPFQPQGWFHAAAGQCCMESHGTSGALACVWIDTALVVQGWSCSTRNVMPS